ncbi:Basic leucine zipper [Ascosphaera apis ARSEF 7405]|uniref:Basic leucine zipper n=1 Tax=Ascosphaera apis ARSEF 7405 TaxID=392613 RepID=A0A168D2N7_9EURO|nr:Basic leucine zipper [Ascosphaera apis ARSEF 7405]
MSEFSAPIEGWDSFEGFMTSLRGLDQPAAQPQQQQQQQDASPVLQQQTPLSSHDLFLGDSTHAVSPSQLSLSLPMNDMADATKFMSPAFSQPGKPDVPATQSSGSASVVDQSSIFMPDSSSIDTWSPLFDTQMSQDLFNLYDPVDFITPAVAPGKGFSAEQQLFAAFAAPLDFSDSELSSSGSFSPATTFSLSPQQQHPTPELVPLPSLQSTPQTADAVLCTQTTQASCPAPKPCKVTKSRALSSSPAPASHRESSVSYADVPETPVAGEGSTDEPAVPRISRRARKEPLPEIQFDPEDPVAAKRARNTLAARKSRARRQKQEEWSTKRIRELEEKVKLLEQQSAFWKDKAVEAGVDAASCTF